MKVIVLKANVATENNRVYTRDVLEKAIINYKLKYIKNKISYGEYISKSYTPSPEVTIHNISHQINDLYINDNDELIANIKILNTPAGKKLRDHKKQAKSINDLTFDIRGMGSVTSGVVDNDFKLISIDFIS